MMIGRDDRHEGVALAVGRVLCNDAFGLAGIR